MPLDLARLAAGVARVSIPYADETLEVDYRPERVTGRTFGVLHRAGSGTAADLEALYAELSRIVAAWDLTDDAQPVPTDPVSLERLGMTLLGSVLSAIVADAADPTRAAALRTRDTAATSNGSSPTAILGPAPTTTASSPAPSGPVSIPPTWPASPTPGAPSAGAPG